MSNTSHDIQSELLQIIPLSVLREVAAGVFESTFFCVMCD